LLPESFEPHADNQRRDDADHGQMETFGQWIITTSPGKP
jgi:hypothetical protein